MQLGVEFQYDIRQTGFKRSGPHKISSVETSAGSIFAGMIVNAAGAWANVVAEAASSTIPVRPLRRQVAPTKAGDLLPEDMPMTVYADDGFHLRVRDGRVLLLWPDVPEKAEPYNTNVTDAWIREVKRKAESRIPCLHNVEIDRENCWAGLYEMSPDKHALLGRSTEIENFYLINGSSGHGVMHAPALGHLLAEMMLDGRASTLDVHALRPSRFAEGEPIVGAELL
jgi:sarcosine oxidase subunit beta